MAEFDRKSTKNVNHRPSNATTGLLSTSDRSSCHSHAFSNLRKRIPGDEDDLRVPVFVHSQVSPCSDKDIPNTSRERFSPFISTNSDRSTVAEDNSPLKTAAATCNSSMQPQNACDKSQKPTRTTDMKSKQHVRNQFKENLKETVTGKNHAENSTSISSMGERIAEPLKHDKTSGNQELQNGQVGSRRLCDADAERHQENGSAMFPKICGDADVHLVEPNEVEKENISRERNESCSEASPVNSHRNPERAENGGHYHEEMVHESLQVGDVDGNDDASESSMVDSVLGADISPDDAVGVIGKKRFWKARRAIVNQQKLFAVQVFELHRLIEVQRLIAGSPHLLLDGNPCLGKPPLKESPVKKLTSKYVIKSPPCVKKKVDSQNPNQNAEGAAENTLRKPTPLSNGVNKGLVSQQSCHGPHSGNPPLAPMATDNKSGPWYFYPPPGNRWLVPIMSPSEGLVHKPVVGPCPLTAGFMAPVYGDCGPPSLSPMAGDFMSTAYGIPASHQQGIGIFPGALPVGQTYFPSYGVPVLNPGIFASSVDQTNPLVGVWPHGHAESFSSGDAYFNLHHHSSYNNSNHNSESISCCTWKFQMSKDSEPQGSTASSPCERTRSTGANNIAEGRDPLPLFPMAPAVQVQNPVLQSRSSDQQTRVIRVVPHNRRSATESAARIFQSIQKERQKYDSV
ncbi:PREDICTED: protein HEADING DATE 3B-like isoform X2 [Nelumbo nucifera]|nr:PREDICTED: protein HEADING DATE 3B-like isoform X2 [Nelumbo nucifera]